MDRRTEFLELMKSAVRGQLAVEFDYGGYPRYAVPFLLARTNKNRLVLHAYQQAGSTSNGPIRDGEGEWKYFYLDKIPSVALAPQQLALPPLLKGECFTDAYRADLPKFIVEVLAVVEAE